MNWNKNLNSTSDRMLHTSCFQAATTSVSGNFLGVFAPKFGWNLMSYFFQVVLSMGVVDRKRKTSKTETSNWSEYYRLKHFDWRLLWYRFRLFLVTSLALMKSENMSLNYVIFFLVKSIFKKWKNCWKIAVFIAIFSVRAKTKICQDN